MTPDTPPPPYDHKPAYDWAAAMRGRADYLSGNNPTVPLWREWALVEAYMAGRRAALAEREGQQ